MLYDFIVADRKSKIPMYRQIYLAIRSSIESGNLKKGTKLPSIRSLSADLKVSKITINGAYEQLCAEGYIKSKPQSGYFVEAQFSKNPQTDENLKLAQKRERRVFEYDFSGMSIDKSVINLSEWKSCVKEVLNRDYLLTSYGDVQGEYVLREALQKYGLGTRSVNSSPENIVVGAGAQPLIYTLCSLFGSGRTVAMEKSGFPQAESIFKSIGYKIKYLECDEEGPSVKSLSRIKPDIILINPNYTNKSGTVMPVTRRLEIIAAAKEIGAAIIEDDYNGELRYSTHPAPCFQNYDSENTIYLGSFSKILLPSVRIGYMVLPKKFLALYNSLKGTLNQTASKTEQLALASYISKGKIDVHLRKARRIYNEKSRLMLECLRNGLEVGHELLFNETSLYISVKPQKTFDAEKAIKELEAKSVCVMRRKSGEGALCLGFSGIETDKIEKGIGSVCSVINSNAR